MTDLDRIGTGAGGRGYTAIPGPSVVPDRVLAAMQRASPDIYDDAMLPLVRGITRDLKALAGCTDHVALYIGNGHAAWEASASNLFSPGDRCLVIVTGTFGHGWAEVMRGLGVDVEVLDFGRQAGVDFGRVEEILRADGGTFRAVAMCQTDTSTSIRSDVLALRGALDRAGHPALMLVDGVCSFGCDPFDMAACGADVFISASQKGLMSPAGLCFVFFSEAARLASKDARCRTPYWDWNGRLEPEQFWHYFYGTPPTHNLYALRAALDMIGEEGRSAVWNRHARLARAWWAAMECWGAAGAMRLNVADPVLRSHAVTAARLTTPDGSRLRIWVQENTGLVLGIGLGMAAPTDAEWHAYFRAGHMGHVNPLMVLGAITAVEAGLQALNIPHAPGGATAAAAVFAAPLDCDTAALAGL